MIDFSLLKSLVIPQGNVQRFAVNGVYLWKKIKYKRELLYLESNGTQFIDTGIGGNNTNLRIELAFEILSFTRYGGIFGNHTAETSNCWRMIQYSSDINRGYITPGSITNDSRVIVLTKNTKHTFSINAKGYTMNSTTVTFSKLTLGTDNNTNICVFSSKDGGTTSKMRLYYFKIYDGGVLIRDLIPVLDLNDVPCMYDKVSDELFYNKGDGEFSYGELLPRIPSEYQEVEYLESSGT